MSLTVTILGSASALPTSKRNLTAHLVNHDERFFLIDCGEGTQIQLRRTNQRIGRINHIFISHLHGDHVFGLFGLLSSMSMLGRKVPLHIYSHSKLEEIINAHFAFFQETINYSIIYHPIDSKIPSTIYDDGKLIVSTVPLKHRIPCVGFIFKEKEKARNIRKECIEAFNLGIKDILDIKNGADYTSEDGQVIKNEQLTIAPSKGKSYAYCTDTKVNANIIGSIEGVDVLYHESTFLHSDAKLAKATYHSTAVQAAETALAAKVGKLIIGHFSSRYKHDKMFGDEAIKIFPNTIMAEDGMKIEI